MNTYAIEYECKKCNKVATVIAIGESDTSESVLSAIRCCGNCGHDKRDLLGVVNISQYANELASLQQANADLLAAAEVRSEELGKARQVLRGIVQGDFASIEAAQNAAKKALHCDWALFCEGYQEVPSDPCSNCIAKQWEAQEGESEAVE